MLWFHREIYWLSVPRDIWGFLIWGKGLCCMCMLCVRQRDRECVCLWVLFHVCEFQKFLCVPIMLCSVWIIYYYYCSGKPLSVIASTKILGIEYDPFNHTRLATFSTDGIYSLFLSLSLAQLCVFWIFHYLSAVVVSFRWNMLWLFFACVWYSWVLVIVLSSCLWCNVCVCDHRCSEDMGYSCVQSSGRHLSHTQSQCLTLTYRMESLPYRHIGMNCVHVYVCIRSIVVCVCARYNFTIVTVCAPIIECFSFVWFWYY